MANQPLPISDLSEPITEFTLETLPVESLEIHKNEVLGQDTVKSLISGGIRESNLKKFRHIPAL